MNRPTLLNRFLLRGAGVGESGDDCASRGVGDVAVVGVFVLMAGPPSCVSPVFAPGFGAAPYTLAFAACSMRVRVNPAMLPLAGVMLWVIKPVVATILAQRAVPVSMDFGSFSWFSACRSITRQRVVLSCTVKATGREKWLCGGEEMHSEESMRALYGQ